MPFPLRLQRCDIDDDPASRVSRFPKANGQHVAGNTKVLNRTSQRERIGRNHTNVALNVNKAVFIKMLGVNGRRVNIGKHLELPRAPYVVAIA